MARNRNRRSYANRNTATPTSSQLQEDIVSDTNENAENQDPNLSADEDTTSSSESSASSEKTGGSEDDSVDQISDGDTDGSDDEMSSEQAVPVPEAPEVEDESVVEVGPEVVSENVAKLYALCSDFAEKNTRFGKEPEKFVESAKAVLAVTKHVIGKAHDKAVLVAYLGWLVENQNGVAEPTAYLRGTNLLSRTDELKIGTLYNLFLDIAKKRKTSIDNAAVVRVLGKPELFNFYAARKRGFTKNQ